MNIFNRKKVVEFQSDPYEFKPGSIYIIEVSKQSVSEEKAANLAKWLTKQGVKAYVIGVEGNFHAINPVEQTRKLTKGK